jgi:hypothetical protein
MKQYKDYISKLAREGKNEIFFNSGPEHAAFVMGTIFENANAYVKIYAANFSGQISNKPDYQNGLEKYLLKGKKVKILLQSDKFNSVKEKPDVFRLLKFYSLINPNQIEIKTHPYRLVENEGDSEIHFTVADNKMYRIEEDVDSFTARGNFNNGEEAATLSNLFDKVWAMDGATPISL